MFARGTLAKRAASYRSAGNRGKRALESVFDSCCKPPFEIKPNILATRRGVELSSSNTGSGTPPVTGVVSPSFLAGSLGIDQSPFFQQLDCRGYWKFKKYAVLFGNIGGQLEMSLNGKCAVVC
jgi:hypothetical protein